MQVEPVKLPFAPEPVEEIPLDKSPLATVLLQVRFPGAVSRLQAALRSQELQGALAEWYPFAQQQDSFEVLIAPGQPATTQPGEKTWVLTSDDGQRVMNFSSDAIALTVSDYVSRLNLTTELDRGMAAIQSVVRPPRISRIGVRYLNRVVGQGDLLEWIRGLAEGARGILATQEQEDDNIAFSLSQVMYQFPGEQKKLQARWGLLPPGAMVDAALPAVGDRSWILDVDAFDEQARPFDASIIAEEVSNLASRSYRFFRWVVTPNSLTRFDPRSSA